MTVLLTSYYYKPHFGGIENSLFYLGKELQKRGHTVVLLVSDSDKTKKGRLLQQEMLEGMAIRRFKRFIPIHPLASAFSFFVDYFRIARTSATVKKEFDVKLIVSRHYRVIPSVSSIFKKQRHLYIIPGVARYQQYVNKSLHASLVSNAYRYFSNYVLLPLKHEFQKASLRTTQHIVFSKRVSEQLLLAFPKVKVKSVLLSPGVDTDRFTYRSKPVGDTFSFLIVGRLIKQKGIEMAIQAVSLVAKRHRVRLVVVGDGPLKGKLTELVKELSLESQVELVGFALHPEEYYHRANALLMTSTHESFGQTILEAYASGLPVVAFRSKTGVVDTASSEIVKDGVNGFLCDFSLENLAEKMEACVNLSGEAYAKIAVINREEAVANYSWGAMTDTLMKMI